MLPSAAGAQSPDFLFGHPRGAIAVRTGWVMARAGSDIYTFVENQLTVNKKDFNAPGIGFDGDIALTPRLTAVAGFDFSGSGTNSEYRNLVDNNRLPIKQTTTMRQQDISGGGDMEIAWHDVTNEERDDVHSRWKADGSGRADVTVVQPAANGRFSNCWSAAASGFATVFSPTTGSVSACSYADAAFGTHINDPQ